MMKFKANPLITGVTYSGGEPFIQTRPLITLSKILKEEGYSLWSYSGYTFDKLSDDFMRHELLELLDVVVDGPFVQSLKSLGFSLEEIKNKLMPLDTPEEVAAILSKQALTIQEQIQQLSKSLQEIELLKEEVLQMQQVDFKKYADIIVNLQMNNQYYWLIKHFDDSTLDHIRHRFNKDTGFKFHTSFQSIN